MPKVIYLAQDGASTEIDIPVGWSVMEGAIQNGVDGIVAECGGGCACATCHVVVDDAWAGRLPLRSDIENDMLECTASDREENSRLSCQLKMSQDLDGLVVKLPDSQV